MDHYTAPGRSAEKYQRLKKNYDDLARMNAELVAVLKRQHDEVAALVERNDEVLRRCDDFFAEVQAGANGNGNGNHRHD